MRHRFLRRRLFAFSFLVLAALCGVTTSSFAQKAFNEFEVKTELTELDKKSNFWALDFRFKAPRLLKVNLPNRGTRIIWYMWYQMVNRTGQTQTPKGLTFELVSLNTPGVYTDEILFSAHNAIKELEDPTNYQNILNTVKMSQTPIPVSKSADEAFPRTVTGVAIWDGSADDAQKAKGAARDLSTVTRFSIFVRGLSNAFVEVDPKADGLPPIVRYKTLQLNFEKKGDRFSVDSRDIVFSPPATWIYRGSSPKIEIPVAPMAPAKAPAKIENK